MSRMVIEEIINREYHQGVIKRLIIGIDTISEEEERHYLIKADRKIVSLDFLKSLGYDVSKEGRYRLDARLFWLPTTVTVDEIKNMNLFDYDIENLEPYVF